MAYDATNLNDMDETLPLPGPGGTKLGDLDNVLRETRLSTKNSFKVEHDPETGKHNVSVPFCKTVTISAVSAGTAVKFIEDADMPTDKKIYLLRFYACISIVFFISL